MEVNIKYEPRSHFVDFHNRDKRWACLVCHRRAGKTVACVEDLATRATYTPKKNARYAYIAPFYRQAKDVAWTYLKEATDNGLAVKVRESALRVELFNGAWITLYGADNPDALRGLYFDGVVLDEYGDCRPSLWAEVILPTLTDRQGWAVFIGTPKGHNHFYEINNLAQATPDSWYHMRLTATESGILPIEELQEIKRQYVTQPEKYAQEFECSFEAAIQGAYYADLIHTAENEDRICQVPYISGHPLYVASDLGYTDSTAMWFWQTVYNAESGTTDINIVDYHEADSKALSYYFDLLDYLPYEYTQFYLPHDAAAKTLQTGRSTIEQFVEHFGGTKVTLLPKLAVQHGVDAARSLLPRTRFDKEKAGTGVEALRAYQRNYNELTKAFSNQPLHNWASNGADGFRYLALAMKDIAPKKEPKAEFDFTKPVQYTLDQLYEERSRTLNTARSAYKKMRV